MSHKNVKETHRRLKKLCDETRCTYKGGAWFSNEKGRYVRYSPSHKSQYPKHLKKLSNRKIRQSKDILNYGAYKKAFDYAYSLS